jgi:hypothetical protein
MVTVRKWLVGMLLVALAFPAWTPHVCGCATRFNANRQRAVAATKKVRPCCAQKQMARPRTPPQSEVRAKCCCDEVRWNESVAKMSSPRFAGLLTTSAFVASDVPSAVSATVAPLEEACGWCIVRAGPMAPMQVVFCRWQV